MVRRGLHLLSRLSGSTLWRPLSFFQTQGTRSLGLKCTLLCKSPLTCISPPFKPRGPLCTLLCCAEGGHALYGQAHPRWSRCPCKRPFAKVRTARMCVESCVCMCCSHLSPSQTTEPLSRLLPSKSFHGRRHMQAVCRSSNTRSSSTLMRFSTQTSLHT